MSEDADFTILEPEENGFECSLFQHPSLSGVFLSVKGRKADGPAELADGCGERPTVHHILLLDHSMATMRCSRLDAIVTAAFEYLRKVVDPADRVSIYAFSWSVEPIVEAASITDALAAEPLLRRDLGPTGRGEIATAVEDAAFAAAKPGHDVTYLHVLTASGPAGDDGYLSAELLGDALEIANVPGILHINFFYFQTGGTEDRRTAVGRKHLETMVEVLKSRPSAGLSKPVWYRVHAELHIVRTGSDTVAMMESCLAPRGCVVLFKTMVYAQVIDWTGLPGPTQATPVFPGTAGMLRIHNHLRNPSGRLASEAGYLASFSLGPQTTPEQLAVLFRVAPTKAMLDKAKVVHVIVTSTFLVGRKLVVTCGTVVLQRLVHLHRPDNEGLALLKCTALRDNLIVGRLAKARKFVALLRWMANEAGTRWRQIALHDLADAVDRNLAGLPDSDAVHWAASGLRHHVLANLHFTLERRRAMKGSAFRVNVSPIAKQVRRPPTANSASSESPVLFTNAYERITHERITHKRQRYKHATVCTLKNGDDVSE